MPRAKKLAAILKGHADYLSGMTTGERGNFSGRNLRGINLSGRDLREADFSRADLQGADLSGCRLCDADFSGANLSHADLHDADLTNVNLSETLLHGANLSGTFMESGDNLNIVHRPHRQSSTGVDQGAAVGFPKVLQYFGTDGSGFPLMTSPGVFDMSYINACKNRQVVRFSTSPFTNPDSPANFNLIGLVRAANPKIFIQLADVIQQRFAYGGPTSQWAEEWTLVGITPPDKVLYFDAGHGGDTYPFHGGVGMYWNMAMGGTATATAYAALWKKYCMGKTDGYWFDLAISNLTVAGGSGAFVDLARGGGNGYANAAAIDTANTAAYATFFDAMQGTGYMVGNRGPQTWTPDSIAAKWQGECFELFDTDQGFGGTQPPHNYASFDAWIAVAMGYMGKFPNGDGGALCNSNTLDSIPAVHSAAWNKCVRYTLGSATLVGGAGFMWAAFTSPNPAGECATVFDTADEFAVTPQGVSDVSATGQNTGWLGRPTEALPTKDAGGLWVRRFQNGIVLVNGTVGGSLSITLERPYKRIQGVYDTSANNGATVTTQSVPAKDARFLLRT